MNAPIFAQLSYSSMVLSEADGNSKLRVGVNEIGLDMVDELGEWETGLSSQRGDQDLTGVDGFEDDITGLRLGGNWIVGIENSDNVSEALKDPSQLLETSEGESGTRVLRIK